MLNLPKALSAALRPLTVAKALYEGCESLMNMPNRGRTGRRPATRELVFTDLPYIAV
jgi:plasmid stabilization system protein ParE